jgi:antitoxin (DNA-binding transcriptional repressor) of toxin-antitoxin stability system
MKFVGIRDLRNDSSRVLSELGNNQEIILTNSGKPVALITAVSESTLENTLKAIRQAMAIQAVNRMQNAAMKMENRVTEEEIEAEILAVRRKRKA